MSTIFGKNTWIHESFHFYQQIKQTWAGQMGRGMYEQWYLALLKGSKYVYGLEGTNEFGAFDYAECYYPIKHLIKFRR